MDIMKYLHNHCYTHKGIFREPGLKRMEKIIKSKLDLGETFDWATEQTNYCLPNVAASLLKSYFRSLPEGLFLKSLFPDFERWRETGQILMSLFTKFYLKFSQFMIMVGKELTAIKDNGGERGNRIFR